MRKISILIPCFNERENVREIGTAVSDILIDKLPQYDYEICFIDNASTDGTRDIIEDMCSKDTHYKAIFNVTNFGQFNSPFHGMCALDGDCVIAMCADFQDPPELIPQFVHEWEQGHKVVCGVKSTSKENPFLYLGRTLYYKILKRFSSANFIEHLTGFGLFDKSFIRLLRELDDSLPFLRGIVAEYGEGFNLITIEYEQPLRRAGKTHNNFGILYDAAMLSFTSYTKAGLRIATFLGFIVAVIDFFIAIVYLLMKLLYWDRFSAGSAPTLIGMFMIGAIQLIFLGLIGEYIININTRVIHRPVVVEEQRLNF